jgi:S1-C subfamily serine protease
MAAISVCAVLGTTASLAGALPLQEIIARAEPAVVHVSISNERGTVLGTGSGFVISSDGRLVTNHHVVELADRVEVTFQDGRKVEIEGVVAFDEKIDLAVLKLRKGTYPKLALAAGAAQRGDSILVMGSPLGFSGSVSTGIVSAVRPDGATIAGERRASWELQLSAAISSGSSGSPILNDAGEVVAIAVGGLGAPVGQPVNFGVPVARLKQLVAASSGETRPLRVLRGARSSLENLLISAALLTGAVFAWWLTVYLRGRRRRGERDRGRQVIGSILKP